MRRGFTLIEVLVVVAIIAVLISILLPSLKTARDMAKSAKCLANLQDMGVGSNTFRNGHKNRLQIVTYPDGQAQEDPDRSVFAYESGGLRQLLGYPLALLREAGVRSLPTNDQWGILGSVISANKGNMPGNLRKFELMMCPADTHLYGTFGYPFAAGSDNALNYYYGYLSYGINMDLVGVHIDPTRYPNNPVAFRRGIWKDGIPSGSTTIGTPGRPLAGRLDSVIRPSEVVLLADAGSTDPLSEMITLAGVPLFFGTGAPNNGQTPMGPYLEFVDKCYGEKLNPQRHATIGIGGRSQKLNLNYADGHGGTVTKVPGYAVYASYATAFPGVVTLPTDAFLPRARVSPYNVGSFPTELK